MYSTLQPELRGARRILKSLSNTQTTSTHRTVRSFSKSVQLQAQSDSGNSETNPKKGDRPDVAASGLPNYFPKTFREKYESLFQQPSEGSQASSPPDHSDKPNPPSDAKDSTQQHDTEYSAYTEVKDLADLKDLPLELRNIIEQAGLKPPFQIQKGKLDHESPDLSKPSQDAEKVFEIGGDAPQEGDNARATNFYGSSAARRLRARASRGNAPASKPIPSWFLDQNVILYKEQVDCRAEVGTVSRKNTQKYGGKPTFTDVTQQDESTEGLVQLPLKNEEILQDTAKEKAFSPGGSNAPPWGNDGQVRDGKELSETSAGGDSVPFSNMRYYIEPEQRRELMLTISGRLRYPPESNSLGRPRSNMANHLSVLYASTSGQYYLAALIRDMSKRLETNLISLDASDIATLIAKADIDGEIAADAGSLDYQVYSEVYTEKDDNELGSSSAENDFEADDEDEVPNSNSMGMPFMIGKPITIDLTNMMGGRGGMTSGSGGADWSSRDVFSKLISRGSGGGKDGSHIFSGIVESVLSSASHKATKSSTERAANLFEKRSRYRVEDGTIIHINNEKALRNTHIGQQFLSELMDQVDRRIATGQRLIVVGTNFIHKGEDLHGMENLEQFQRSRSNDMSTDIIITPTHPENRPLEFLDEDKKRHVRYINVRHLWNALQARGLNLSDFEAGFWARDYEKDLNQVEMGYLSTEVFPALLINRLTAVIAAAKDSDASWTKGKGVIEAAMYVVGHSDSSRKQWWKLFGRPPQKIHTEESPEALRLARIRQTATKHEKALMSGVIEPKKISTTFRDIHIPPETVEALQTLTTLSLVRPEAFRYGVLASDRIPGLLLYGPPGTGKTLAAKAVARESGATMLEVSAADLNDMYVGEGEKNVKALFSLAKKLSPCVVFLDEADAMFSARSNQGRRVSHRELLNQFLKEWDGMSNDSGSAFIMVATNRPMDLDDAVLRRLPRRLLVDLPNEADRLEILKIHLRHEHVADEVNLADLAHKTPFYSGSDLKNVAVAAALNCVREENEEAKKHYSDLRQARPNDMQPTTKPATPVETNNDADVEVSIPITTESSTLERKPYIFPAKRTLRSEHFTKALEEISASISEDMTSLREIRKFDEQFGDKRGKKKKAPRWGFRSVAEPGVKVDTIKVRN